MRSAVGLILLATGCAATNHASGTISGRPWSGDLVEAEYCEHCSGGLQVTALIHRRADDLAVEVTSVDCALRKLPATFVLGRGHESTETYVSTIGAHSGQTISGEVHARACTRELIDLSFTARFEDGSEVHGNILVKPTVSEGYD